MSNYLFNNHINVARSFKEEGNKLKALQFYKKAYNFEEGKKDIELLLDMALLYHELEQMDLAEEKYREVLEIDNNEERAYYGLGYSL